VGDGVGVGVDVGTGIGVGITAGLDVRQLVSTKLIATKLINDIFMGIVSSVYHIYLLN
jgi:hypothetical protein